MSQPETLVEWLEWLEFNHPTDKIELGLERLAAVAAKLQLASPKAPVITVAGTNGKGSVIATLESLAEQHNLNVGSYTSPHLIQFNERVKLNGEPVSDTLLVQAFARIAKAQEATPLTYFEFTTLVALYIFSQQQLDFIALEVGLGGRLDAVNIVDADIAVITSIGLDHTDWLGDDLFSIAQEKAGVTRQGRPVILASETLEPLFEEAFARIKPQVLLENKDYQIIASQDHWSLKINELKFESLANSSLYIPNMAAAIVAFHQLFAEKVQSAEVQQAIAQATLMGRFYRLSNFPPIIVDVAHNPDSAKLLNTKLAQLDKDAGAKIWAICGMLKDKDIANSLAQMVLVDHWLLIDLATARGADGNLLQQELNFLMDQQALPVARINNFGKLEAAYRYFSENADNSDYLVVFGSFVTVGQMLEYWQQSLADIQKREKAENGR
ncbi:folylpolyglutamate synthase/dihydrofolate synthase family protein [Kangiella sp. TOML190]|uniref:bifunctional folylpolyglutamate synthase/dihydrofolate synthase n=1 Tax=Kangiella sp. TOML190 TaxID=2931351 RepID=UPI00203C5637|nr:folylpolyglutamate synthase/dihydrofolate synthase family protein [Kangiella sp. TOML190]